MCSGPGVHNDSLKGNLHRNSVARMSIFLTEIFSLANFVTTQYTWNKTSATPEMTGIPAEVLLMANMEDMKVIISDLKSLLETSFKTTLASKLDESAVEPSRRVSNFVIISFEWAYAEPPTSLSSSSLANVVLKLVSTEFSNNKL